MKSEWVQRAMERYVPCMYDQVVDSDHYDSDFKREFINANSEKFKSIWNLTYKIVMESVSTSPWQELHKMFPRTCGNWSIPHAEYAKQRRILTNMLRMQGAVVLKHFLPSVKKLLNREYGKVNCLLVHGNTDTGKSLLVKSITNALCFKGDLILSARFCFQNLVYKRIAHLEDLDGDAFSENNLSNFKKLLEGQDLEVKVKFSTGVIKNMPVIITSNHTPEEIFEKFDSERSRSRIVEFEFNNSFAMAPSLSSIAKTGFHPSVVVDMIMECDESLAIEPAKKTHSQFVMTETDYHVNPEYAVPIRTQRRTGLSAAMNFFDD